METRLILVALMSCENHPGAKLAEEVSLNARGSICRLQLRLEQKGANQWVCISQGLQRTSNGMNTHMLESLSLLMLK